MRATLVGTRVLLRSRDRATTVLTVAAFALPHAVLLAVVGGVQAFFERSQAPRDALESEGFYLFLACFAGVLIIVPVLSMGAAAARLGLSRRARDLAVLRLLGLPPVRAKAAAVLETTILAAAGVVGGSALYGLTLPTWQTIRFQGHPMTPSEMWTGPGLLAAAAALMVVLAAVSSWFGMRRVAITPLGVARQSDPHRVSPAGAVLAVVVIIAWLGPVQMIAGVGPAAVMAILLGFLAVVLALVNAVGSWAIGVLGRVMASRARTPQMLVAGRRIADDPRSVWRSFGAVALVGFIVGVLFPMFSIIGSGTGGGDDAVMMGDIGTGMLLTLGITVVLAAVSTAVNQSIRVIDGVPETLALVRTGAPTRFLDRSRRLEVGVPAVTLICGSVALGLLFISPMLSIGGAAGPFVAVAGFTVVGIAVILAASETTRPLRSRLLREAAA
jgi:hypothetical protein